MMLDGIEKKIINQLQLGFPICHRPFLECSKNLGISEQELIDVLSSLKQRGYVSRFGPMFDIEKMGGCFCLCAMSVDENEWEDIATMINHRSEVAHNYLRDHELNLWFVVAVENKKMMNNVINELEQQTGHKILALPKEREYFVQLYLEV